MILQNLRKFPDKLGLRTEITEALGDACSSIPRAVRYYFPDGINRLDREDAEATALFEALKYIYSKQDEPETTKWAKSVWYKHIMRRVNNAILEHAKYVFLPMVMPRPLRFSMKKYMEALKILNRYVKASKDVAHSELYTAIINDGCGITDYCDKRACEYAVCPVNQLSLLDLKELHHIIIGKNKSLEYYAQWYRKSLKEWIHILELLRTYSVSNDVPDLPVTPNTDRCVDLIRLRNRLEAIRPNLSNIYVESMEDVDLNRTEDELMLVTPRGWSTKHIKERFGLTSEEYKNLLLDGDRILNEFRVNEGLQKLHRDFQKESSS